jgi:hypothetical protein
MAILPPEVARITDSAIQQALVRLWELIDRLETDVASCEADLAAQQTELAKLPGLERQLKKQDDQLRRVTQ